MTDAIFHSLHMMVWWTIEIVYVIFFLVEWQTTNAVLGSTFYFIKYCTMLARLLNFLSEAHLHSFDLFVAVVRIHWMRAAKAISLEWFMKEAQVQVETLLDDKKISPIICISTLQGNRPLLRERITYLYQIFKKSLQQLFRTSYTLSSFIEG